MAMIPAVYAPTYVYGWQIEPWHVWITIICACLLVLSAWLHGVRYGRTLPVAHDPEHLPDRSKVAATERALGWTQADRPECEVSASCEPGDHTGSWPCEVGPSWTPNGAPTPDEAERMLPLQVAYKSRSET